uniref:hypothetical protein n=1 Tax=Edaphosphingomonas laterariae TaxID=861865 RepID=UPI003CCB774D
MTVSAVLLLAGCVAPAPPPAPPPPPAPVAPPPAPAVPWEDAPLTPGTWTYAGGTARFGVAGQAPLASLACDAASRSLILSRHGTGATAAAIQVTTSYGRRQLAGAASTTGVSARIAGSDGLGDWMAYSRGRIRLDVAGQPPLTLPSWAEISRVVDDCRK